MLVLNKLLPMFVLPLGVALLLLVVAVIWKKRWPIVVAVLLLGVSSLPWVGGKLLGWVESSYPALAIEATPKADAIIVLGGIYGPSMPDGYVSNWSETVERYEGGVRLLQAGRADYLVFTGAQLPWKKRITTEGAELRQEAIARGIDPQRVLVTNYVANTADEAREVAALMRERKWQRVILVTTGWHMRRAAYQFERAGVVFTPFPVDFRYDPTSAASVVDFIPNGAGLAMTETALRETYGYWFYGIFR